MKVDRRILHEFPYPLARAYERAVNADEGKDRHDRALLLFEAFTQWLGIVALAEFRCLSPAARAGFDLSRLERPSRGVWVELLRAVSRVPEGFCAAITGFLRRPVKPAEVDGLLGACRAVLGDEAVPSSPGTLGRVLELLVAYRNRTVGHGASLQPETYALIATPFLEGVTDLVGRAEFLLRSPLFSCEETRALPGGATVATHLRLMGVAPLRERSDASPPGIAPGSLFCAVEGGGAFPLSLKGLAVWRERTLFLFNGVGPDGVPRYLSFEDNRLIADGWREDVFPAGPEEQVEPDAAPAEPATSHALRLRFQPAIAREGELFCLRAEVETRAVGSTVRIRALAIPPSRARFLSAGAEWEGPADAASTLEFQLLALEPGLLRVEVEATSASWSGRRPMEISIAPSSSLPFVGRRREISLFETFWSQKAAGLFVLRGEPGIGKSRLGWELARRAGASGALILCGKGRRSFRSPLQAFREVLLSALLQADPENSGGRGLTAVSAALEALFPRDRYLVDYFTAFLARRPIAAEQRGLSSFHWLQLLRRVMRERPVLVFIDDLQWVETESAQLIAELLSLARQQGAPLKFVGALQPLSLRPDEEEVVREVEGRILDLRADQVVVEDLTLTALEESDLLELAALTFGKADVSLELSWLGEGLRRRTGGNPLFAEWVLKQLREEFALRADHLGLAPTPQLSLLTPLRLEQCVPHEVAAVLDRRLAALDPHARDVLELAALVGDPFDVRILERLAGGPEALDAALPELEAEGLLSPTSSPFFYRFTQAIIVQHAYRALAQGSQWKLSRLHAKAAEAMAAIFSADELNRHALAYAHHLVLGTRLGEGLRYLLLGAHRLIDAQLYASAIGHFEQARALIEQGILIPVVERARLELRLGEAYRVVGKVEPALQAFDAARRLSVEEPALLAAVDLARGSILIQQGELDEAEITYRSVFERERSSSQRASIRGNEAAALSGLAAVHRGRGRLVEARDLHQRALELRERSGDEVQIAISCVNLGNLEFDLGEIESAEHTYRRSLPVFEKHGLVNYRIYALSGLGNVFLDRDRRESERFYAEAIGLCQETGNRAQLSMLRYNLGELAVRAHHYEDAIREYDRTLKIMDEIGRRWGEAGARVRKAGLLRVLGDLAGAENEIALAREVGRRVGSELELAAAELEGAQLSLERRDAIAARSGVDRALRLLAGKAESALWGECACVLLQLGDGETALSCIEEAARSLTAQTRPQVRSAVERLRGLAQHDPALRLASLERALEFAGPEDRALPWILSEIATSVEGARAVDLHRRAVRVLAERAQGIAGLDARSHFLWRHPPHAAVLERARSAGVDLEPLHSTGFTVRP